MISNKNIHINHLVRRLKFPCKVETFGYSRSNLPLNRRTHKFPDQIEICIRTLPENAASDMAHMTLGGREYHLHYPHVLIKLPQAPYTYHHLGTRDVIFFAYSSSLMPELEKYALSQPPLAWEFSQTSEIEYYLNRLTYCMNESDWPGLGDRIDVTCFQLLSELLLVRHDPDFIKDGQDALMRIDSFFRFHFNELVSLEEIARKHGLSRTSFFRKWNERFGSSPAEYLRGLRLLEACRLLERTNYKIKEIAQAVGIPDSAYFCAIFRKYYGITPQKYRKNNASL